MKKDLKKSTESDMTKDVDDLRDICEKLFGCGKKMDDYGRRFDGSGGGGTNGGGTGSSGTGITT